MTIFEELRQSQGEGKGGHAVLADDLMDGLKNGEFLVKEMEKAEKINQNKPINNTQTNQQQWRLSQICQECCSRF